MRLTRQLQAARSFSARISARPVTEMHHQRMKTGMPIFRKGKSRNNRLAMKPIVFGHFCRISAGKNKPRQIYFSGTRQASTTCKSLSRAKFMTKSQAIGSCWRKAVLTTTHLMLFMVVGTHQGE